MSSKGNNPEVNISKPQKSVKSEDKKGSFNLSEISVNPTSNEDTSTEAVEERKQEGSKVSVENESEITKDNDNNQPQMRKWTARRSTNSRQSYKELVASKEAEHRKMEQTFDLANWSKPKENPLREGYLEVAEYDPVKKNWDKKWFMLYSVNLYWFKNKKGENPIGVIHLLDSTVEEAADEKTKKHCFKIFASKSFLQETLLKDRSYWFLAESSDDMKRWINVLRSVKSNVSPEEDTTNSNPSNNSSANNVSTSSSPIAITTAFTSVPTSSSSSVSTSTTHSDKSEILRNNLTMKKLGEEDPTSRTTATPISTTTTTTSEESNSKDTSNANTRGSQANKDKRGSLTLKAVRRVSGSLFGTNSNSSLSSPTSTSSTSLSSAFSSSSPSMSSEPLPTQSSSPEVPAKPVFYFNQLFGQCNAILALITENNIDMERIVVHSSWILPSYGSNPPPKISLKESNGKRFHQPFRPRFVLLNPDQTVPVYAYGNQVLTNSSEILRCLAAKFGLSEHWYPEEPKIRKKINEILDTWGVGKVIMETLKIVMFDKILNPTSTPPQYQYQNLLKEIAKIVSRLDSELQKQKFLSGDSMTIADLGCYGELLMLRFINYDLSKTPNVRKWQKEIELQLPSLTTFLSEFDSIVKQYNKVIEL